MYSTTKIYFNSNMVRLRRSLAPSARTPCLFQFQYGAIKTQTTADFNVDHRISIPLWCD